MSAFKLFIDQNVYESQKIVFSFMCFGTHWGDISTVSDVKRYQSNEALKCINPRYNY